MYPYLKRQTREKEIAVQKVSYSIQYPIKKFYKLAKQAKILIIAKIAGQMRYKTL